MNDDNNLLLLSYKLLDEACEENRHRDAEIMQGIDGEKEHAKAVLLWVEKLTENPPIELKISALFHDVDRIVTPGVGGGFKGDRKSKEYEQHKKAHAKRSADYIYLKLIQNRVSNQLAETVKFLILHHDDTGSEIEALSNKELNILVSADSLAFFNSIAPKLYKAEGEQRLKDKIRFMVDKMPVFARNMLASQQLENEVFNRIKDEIIKEFKQHES